MRQRLGVRLRVPPRLLCHFIDHARVGRAEYAYEAPTVGFAGTLKVSPSGAVIWYPGLFELMSTG